MTAASEASVQASGGSWHDIDLRTSDTELMDEHLLPFFLLLSIFLAWPGLVHHSLPRALVPVLQSGTYTRRRLVAETIFHL
jgi:hypothetical protein